MSRYKLILIILLLCFFNACDDDYVETAIVEYPTDIYTKLSKIPGLTVNEISPQNGASRQFEIYVQQPLDHTNVTGEKFNQIVYLSYVGVEAPVIFNPNGYAVSPRMKSELSDLLTANDIHVGHRYFNGSKPGNNDWQYLTIEQAAADHHAIVELLKPVLSGPWISAGHSKSGVTALFHRKFYPNDVDATVAYVAPISRQPEDPRYNEYILTLGTEEERTIIKNYQRGLLLRRDELIPKIDSFMNTMEYSFSLTASQILEINAIEFWFSFWQYYDDFILEDIPGEDATVNEYFSYYEREGSTAYYSDPWIDYFMPLYYQVFTQLGYCKHDYSHFEDLLVEYPDFTYKDVKAPKDVVMNFDPSTVSEIVNWLENEGSEIIYIYGELDPWTAGQINISNSSNCLKIIAQGYNHTVKIDDLTQKNQVVDSVLAWSDLNNK